MRRWLGTGIIGIILSWLSSVDTYIRYLAGYRPIIRGTPGASHFRLISLANTETLLSPSFILVKHCSIWELHLFTIRQSLIQSLHLSIKTLPSLSSMLLQISSVIAFEKPPFWRKTMDQSTVRLICCVFLVVLWPEGWEEGYGRWDLRWCSPPLSCSKTLSWF